jgi:hypothetical protein
MQHRCLAAAALLCLAACAAFDPRTSRVLTVDALIGETVQAARAPVGEQRSALARAEKTFATDPSAMNRLRVATLLATLPEPLRNDARASELLEPIVDASDAGIGRLAALLRAQVAERRQAAAEAERAARERDRNDKERDKREEALRQQLEALRAIERGIMEREERLRRRQH